MAIYSKTNDNYQLHSNFTKIRIPDYYKAKSYEIETVKNVTTSTNYLFILIIILCAISLLLGGVNIIFDTLELI